MKELYKGTTEIHSPPKNIRNEDLPMFESFFSKECAPTTIEELRDADVLKDAVFNIKYFRFYQESFLYNYKLRPVSKLIRLSRYLGSFSTVDKGIWITDNWTHGYFHWFCEALTRLVASDSVVDNHYVLLPASYQNLNFVAQSLEYLDFKPFYYNPEKRLRVKELLLPSHTALPGYYNHLIIKKLRDKFRARHLTTPTRKIYISRQKASKRRVLNEDMIISTLKYYGYEIHCFEDYDFNKQLSLMQEASHLVGMHGAGLTNMLFMPPHGKVLEFRIRESEDNHCFYMLAADLSLDYYYMVNAADGKLVHTANITVNVNDLKQVLEQME